jgi:2-keto-4-pentenoate hydratase/2-oxohepta-3-ene-1,7-dioic acid hydratase in catechol pathway
VRAARFLDPTGAERLGAYEDGGIRDAGPAGPLGFVPSEEGWEAIANASGPEYGPDEVRLLHPGRPRKLIGIGLNYRDHAAESELEVPSVPVVFGMWPSALAGPDEPIVVPRDENRPDYEGELAIVVGKRVKDVPPQDAREAIGGYSAFNDVSGRKFQLETPLRQFTLGKSFDTFAPMGPCVASVGGDELGALAIRCTVSGEVMQESSTENLIFSVEELVSYCSIGTTLEPGDVIATGTPAGVGDSRKPPRYLRDGDVVEVWVEGVGTLRNPVRIQA